MTFRAFLYDFQFGNQDSNIQMIFNIYLKEKSKEIKEREIMPARKKRMVSTTDVKENGKREK